MTIKVGITGNIGSGKSTVCRIFETLDIPVIYADQLAKRLIQERLHLRVSLLDIVGKEAYHLNGQLNRGKVAEQIFSNDSKRSQVNEVVHKEVHQYLLRWFVVQHAQYAIEEAALTYESGGHHQLDYVIVVHTPFDLRKERVMNRDGISDFDFEKRDKAQMDAEQKMKLADFVIYNDGRQSLVSQVTKIHRTLVELSKTNKNGN